MILFIVAAILLLVGIPALFIDHMLITTLIVIYGAAIAVALILSASRYHAAIVKLGHTCAIVSTFLLFATLVTTAVAFDQGLWTLNAPAKTVIQTVLNNKTPSDQSSFAYDKTDCVIAFYRFGCHDCEATHDAINQWADDNNLDLYWVSTRSELGKPMFLKSGVNEVPALMAINADGESMSFVAYTVDDDNNVVLNQIVCNKLINFLERS